MAITALKVSRRSLQASWEGKGELRTRSKLSATISECVLLGGLPVGSSLVTIAKSICISCMAP